MEKTGFKALETEWWHFSWNNPNFELLDIDPKKNSEKNKLNKCLKFVLRFED